MLSDLSRAERSLLVIRVVLAMLIFVHGVSRWWFDAIEPFGGFLNAQGFPLGLWIAYLVTLIEVIGTPLLAIGRWVTPLCMTYGLIYTFGIVLVHWPEGWFVVGLGRNGVEYSVLIITCLLGLAYQHRPSS